MVTGLLNGFPSLWGYPSSLVGLFHGDSDENGWQVGVPPFQGNLQICNTEWGYANSWIVMFWGYPYLVGLLGWSYGTLLIKFTNKWMNYGKLCKRSLENEWDTPTIMGYVWLVAWNMSECFHSVGNKNLNWRTHIFSEGLKPPTSIYIYIQIDICPCMVCGIHQSIPMVYGFDLRMGWKWLPIYIYIYTYIYIYIYIYICSFSICWRFFSIFPMGKSCHDWGIVLGNMLIVEGICRGSSNPSHDLLLQFTMF